MHMCFGQKGDQEALYLWKNCQKKWACNYLKKVRSFSWQHHSQDCEFYSGYFLLGRGKQQNLRRNRFFIGSHPNFYAVFSQLSWHELSKGKVALYAIIPSLIDIFFEGSWLLEITQNHVHNSANFEQAIVIIISALWFLGWIAKMHILADFLKEILCHSLLNSYIANIAIGGPVHGDSWQGIDSHDNTQAKISLQFSFVYVCPLCEPCCWLSQLLCCIMVCFFHNEIKNWFSE